MRGSSRFLALLVAMAATLVVAPSAQAAFPGANGKIAFTSDRDSNQEICTMEPDGTALTNITNHPGVDQSPAW
jgi:hypothetical protein